MRLSASHSGIPSPSCSLPFQVSELSPRLWPGPCSEAKWSLGSGSNYPKDPLLRYRGSASESERLFCSLAFPFPFPFRSLSPFLVFVVRPSPAAAAAPLDSLWLAWSDPHLRLRYVESGFQGSVGLATVSICKHLRSGIPGPPTLWPLRCPGVSSLLSPGPRSEAKWSLGSGSNYPKDPLLRYRGSASESERLFCSLAFPFPFPVRSLSPFLVFVVRPSPAAAATPLDSLWLAWSDPHLRLRYVGSGFQGSVGLATVSICKHLTVHGLQVFSGPSPPCVPESLAPPTLWPLTCPGVSFVASSWPGPRSEAKWSLGSGSNYPKDPLLRYQGSASESERL